MTDRRKDPRVEFGRAQVRRFLADLTTVPLPVRPELDEELEQRFQDAVAKRFPGDCVVGEELPPLGTWSGSGWLIDPIDGTSNLIHGLPWFGTSLAYFEEGRPTLGWVTDPVRGEIYEAIAGGGATVEGMPIDLATTACSRLVAASRRWRLSRPGWRDLLPKGCKDRLLGATAIELAWVARGILGAGAWARTRTFDIAAGWLILAESGAVLRSTHGSGAPSSWPPLLAADPTSERLDLVAGHPDHAGWLEQLLDTRVRD